MTARRKLYEEMTMRTPVTIAVLLAAMTLAAHAQVATGAGGYDPVGVYVDAEGVLRSRTTEPDGRLTELWKKARGAKPDDGLVFISLPRLFAEAKRLLDEGKPLPPDIRHLGGMTRLRYVFVYPDQKDLVIAGPAEPFDDAVPFRPLGQVTGRPVLHLEDLVTALRAFGPGRKPDRVGCDIQITQEVADRLGKAMTEFGAKAATIGIKAAAEKIAQAGGQQPVKYYGVDPDTRFAFVCVEADYRLKQLALGQFPSPVAAVKSYKSLLPSPERAHRFSLESAYDALLASADGRAFELRGPSLKVNSGLLGKSDSTDADISAAAKRFKDLCNEHFEALTRHMVDWADLANLGDLCVAAALIAGDGLADKASWDASWVLAPKGFPVTHMTAPKSAQTLCATTSAGKMLIFVTGGVWINPREWAEKRVVDDRGALDGKPLRPSDEEGWRAAATRR